MVVAGALNTVFSKMQYTIRSRGTELCVDPSDPSRLTDLCVFDKPWFGSLLARVGMALPWVCVSVHKWVRRRRGSPSEKAPLIERRDTETTQLSPKTMAIIAGLSLLDLSQTLLGNVGLLWVSSSVQQMARGSVVLFSALISVRFLGRSLVAYHYASIAIVTLALALVCWAGVPEDSSDSATSSVASADAALGLALVVLAQLVTAVQIVCEEHLMTAVGVDPLKLVGLEGLWGLLVFVFLVPLLSLSPRSRDAASVSAVWREDFGDTLAKLAHSRAQVVLSALNVAAVAVLGASANVVTQRLSAVVRALAEVLRTLGVWVAALALYYAAGWRGAGEPWTPRSWYVARRRRWDSALRGVLVVDRGQLGGFVLLVIGSLAYEKTIRLPIARLYPYPSS